MNSEHLGEIQEKMSEIENIAQEVNDWSESYEGDNIDEIDDIFSKLQDIDIEASNAIHALEKLKAEIADKQPEKPDNQLELWE